MFVSSYARLDESGETVDAQHSFKLACFFSFYCMKYKSHLRVYDRISVPFSFLGNKMTMVIVNEGLISYYNSSAATDIQ